MRAKYAQKEIRQQCSISIMVRLHFTRRNAMEFSMIVFNLSCDTINTFWIVFDNNLSLKIDLLNYYEFWKTQTSNLFHGTNILKFGMTLCKCNHYKLNLKFYKFNWNHCKINLMWHYPLSGEISSQNNSQYEDYFFHIRMNLHGSSKKYKKWNTL